MWCLLLLQKQFFQRDVDKHTGIATVFCETGDDCFLGSSWFHPTVIFDLHVCSFYSVELILI